MILSVLLTVASGTILNPMSGLVGMNEAKKVGEPLALPPKPSLISEKDYESLAKCAQYAEDGNPAMALGGFYSLLLRDGVKFTFDDDSLNAAQRQKVECSMERWNKWLNGNVFSSDDFGQPSKVTIKLVRSLPTGVRRDSVGTIFLKRTIGSKNSVPTFSVDATVYILERLNGLRLRDDELEQVVSHEVGHLFGLSDHDSTSGLMGKFKPGRPRTELSQNERESLTLYRSTISAMISRTSTMFKIGQRTDGSSSSESRGGSLFGTKLESQFGPKGIDFGTHIFCHGD
jgi:hypothetical protein